MKKRNNKGFFLVETLIVTTIVALAMVFLYTQIVKLIDGYELRLTYNTVDGTYGAVEFNKYILNDSAMYSYYTNSANITSSAYVNVACANFTSPSYCSAMYSTLGVSRMIVTTYNTAAIKTAAPTIDDFSDDLKLFISNIKGVNNAPTTKYRLIIEYTNGTYATVALNSGTDKTAPTITGNQTLYVLTGESYNPSDGLIATDNVYGNISNNIVCTLISSNNYICTVTDSSGNVSANFYRIVSFYSNNFTYTGAVQTYTVPTTGYYKIELWGAQGGGVGGGGNGAYVSGYINLTQGTILYVYVGSMGIASLNPYTLGSTAGWNGGGDGGYFTSSSLPAKEGGGGGASDIRLVGGNWNDSSSLISRIMVAAGGGGGAGDVYGGYGGGLIGANGTASTGSGAAIGYGGTQTVGGSGHYSGAFGQGGAGYISSPTSPNCNDAYGAGGGYYGGGGGTGGVAGCSPTARGAGGGGSSFISGYTGCNAVNSSGTATGQPNHYSGKVFINSTMIAGNASMPSTSGSTETGQTGNGYARITFLSA